MSYWFSYKEVYFLRSYGAPVLWLAVRMSLPENFISFLRKSGATIDMKTAHDGTTIRQVIYFILYVNSKYDQVCNIFRLQR